MPNPFSKRRDIDNAYATYRAGPIEWRVLKTYNMPKNDNQFSRWFVAARSPMTYGDWEMGDTYALEIKRMAYLESATEEWREHYG